MSDISSKTKNYDKVASSSNENIINFKRLNTNVDTHGKHNFLLVRSKKLLSLLQLN